MSKLQSIFLVVIAVVFLASSVAFATLVIMEDRNSSDNAAIEQALKEQQNKQTDAACQIGSIEGATTEAVPEVFKPEADVTELATTDLSEGSGEAAKAGDCLQVKYHGTFAVSGEKFDGNFDQPTALKFALGQSQVISGWDQGVVGMKPGGLRRIVIPSDLAYGPEGRDGIPGNSDLVFVVKLLKIGE